MLVSEGGDRQSVEDTVLGVQPALPRRTLPALAVRRTRPGLVPAFREEGAERERSPAPRSVDVARERIEDDIEETHVPLSAGRCGADTRSWLSLGRADSDQNQARRHADAHEPARPRTACHAPLLLVGRRAATRRRRLYDAGDKLSSEPQTRCVLPARLSLRQHPDSVTR